MPHTIVVVPCYNEAARLDVARFQEFVRHRDAPDFLLVNDGSSDRTLELLEKLNEASPRRFSFLHLAANSGKAEAVRQGVLLALESRPAYVGFWDADLATPLSDIPSFATVLDERPEIDLVVGSRMPLLGRRIDRHPLRQVLGRAFARAAAAALGMRIYDTQCGAKLFRVTPEVCDVFARPFLARWTFDVEILARLVESRRSTRARPVSGSVYEYPLDAWRDVAGSKVKPLDFARSFVEVLRIYWTYLRPGHRVTSAAERHATGREAAPAPSQRRAA